ncbi:28168_t:CDS:2, partial [Racocetra persica]
FLVETDRLLLNEEINDKLFPSVHQNLEELIQSDAFKVLQIVFKYDIFESFREQCLKLICANPSVIFEHSKFTQLDSHILTLILQLDDLGKLSEVSILNYLIEWGIAQISDTIQEKNMEYWQEKDYIIFRKAIHEFIPLIRWFRISKKEFKEKRQLLKSILSEDLFNSILSYNLDSRSLPVSTKLLPSRTAPSPFKPKITKKATKSESSFSSYEELVDMNKKLFQMKDYYDVIVRVGEGCNFKDFYAHSLILCARSSYFETAFSNKDDNNPFIFTIPNIHADIFEIILRYLYVTEFDLEKLNGANILLLIVAANKMDLRFIISNLLSATYFTEIILKKLNGAEILKLIMMTDELKIQKDINDILSENSIVKAILDKFDGAEVLEIIEKSEELQLQEAISASLSNKDLSNIIIRKFNANDILKLVKISLKSRKAIDDLLTSYDFIKYTLDKLNIEQFLQFMQTAAELPTKVTIDKLFSDTNLKKNLKTNLKLITTRFQGAEVLRILIETNALQLQNSFSSMSSYVDQNLDNLFQNDAVGVLQIIFGHDICEPFREYCIYLTCLYPNALFGSPKLIQLDPSILILILQRDDMGKLDEKTICDYLIKWGTAQNKTTQKNMKTWTSHDYKIFERAIHEFIPLI